MRTLSIWEQLKVIGGTVCFYNTDPKQFYIELHSVTDSLVWGYAAGAALLFSGKGVYVSQPGSEWIPLTVRNYVQYGIENIERFPESDFYRLTLA